MATIHDLIEVTSISANTTYSVANGRLLGVVDGMTSSALTDGEFDKGDAVTIEGLSYSITEIYEPDSNGSFTLADGTTRSFSPGSESNLSVVFLTVTRGTVVRHFIIPNDSYGNLNVVAITTGAIGTVAGSDAAIISTQNNQVNVVCFTLGSLVETHDGQRVPVERLVRNDRVLTADHGMEPVVWVGVQRLGADLLARHPHLRPVRIAAGVLGDGYPSEALCLSPQHRVLVRSPVAERMFGVQEVLVAASQLVALDGVDVVDARAPVDYVHVLLSTHEIIFANGLACESLFLGPQALLALDPAARNEVTRLFPDLGRSRFTMQPSRILVPGRKARALVRRHLKNGCPMVLAEGAVWPRRPRAQDSLSATFMSLTR